MRLLSFVAAFFLIFQSAHGNQPEQNTDKAVQWSVHSTLPPLSGYDAQPGLAGTYAGIIDNKLVIAGGANFPDDLPWEGGAKQYWSDVYVLPLDGPEEWTVLPHSLPKNLAYGESITLPEGILLIGGENAEGVMIGLVGSILVQIWISQTGLVHLLLFAATGFISCFLIGYVASIFVSKNDRDISHLTVYSLWNRNNDSSGDRDV